MFCWEVIGDVFFFKMLSLMLCLGVGSNVCWCNMSLRSWDRTVLKECVKIKDPNELISKESVTDANE